MRRRRPLGLVGSVLLVLVSDAVLADPVTPVTATAAASSVPACAELATQYQFFIDAKRRKDDQALSRVLMPSVLLIKQRNMAQPEGGSAYLPRDLLLQGRWHVIAEFRREWVPSALRLDIMTVSLMGDKATVMASVVGAGLAPITYYHGKEEREQVMREGQTKGRGSSFRNDLCFMYIWGWNDTWLRTPSGWKLQVIRHHLLGQMH